MNFKSVLMGRTDEGERVYLTVQIRHREGERQTIEHETITEHDQLSIVGDLIPPRARNIVASGQITRDFRRITRPVKGLTGKDIERVLQIWHRWHMNDFRALCAHQKAVFKDTTYGVVPDYEKTENCPHTGYRPGSAWLVEELDGDDMMWLEDIMNRAATARG